MKKPEQILKLEEYYGIELEQLTESNKNKDVYEVENGQVVSLYFTGNTEIFHFDGFKHLTKLRKLSAIGILISDISGIKYLQELKFLDLSMNRIVDTTPISYLTNLSHLILGGHNYNTLIPIQKLTSLEKLEISNSEIKTLPTLRKLTKLKELNLYDNNIEDLGFLKDLFQLTSLNLDGNKITDISVLNNLINLTSLNLRFNKIENLAYLDKLKALTNFQIRGNPCKNYPEELHCDNDNDYDDFNCLPHYKSWFEDIKKGKEKNKQVKVFFTGNGNVGKSSIIEALKYGKCDKCLDSTHGIIIETFPSKNNEIIMNVWDFGGQEIFYGTHKLFIKGDAINCIVFDSETEQQFNCNDRKTNENVRNFPVQFWYDNAWQNNKINPTLVIQNKIDNSDEIESILLSTVHIDEKKYDTPLINISATHGINIENLEEQIINEAKHLNEYNMDMPKSWLDVRRHILSIQNKENSKYKKTITKEDFQNICIEFNVLNTSINSILYFLHNCGVIYYNEDYLEDKIIIDQRWAIDAIYKVFDRGSDFYILLREFNRGYCCLNRLYTAWGKEYTDKEQELFVSFMNSCGLCFPVRNNTYNNNNYSKDCIYVFPEFLRVEPPANIKLIKSKFNSPKVTLTKEHLYLSSQIIQSVISKLSEYAELDNIWKNGICLNIEGQIAIIEADYEKKSIIFSFSETLQRSKILTTIISILDIRYEIEKWKIKYPNQLIFNNVTLNLLNNLLYNFKQNEDSIYEDFESVDNIKLNTTNLIDGLTLVNCEASKKNDIIDEYKVHHVSPLIAFVSYSKKDGELKEDGKDYLQEFKITLQPLINQTESILIWDDTKLFAGEDWDNRIKEELGKSDIIFFLLSRYLLATNYVNETEMKIATDRLEKNECIIIPVLIKTCPFQEYPIFKKPNVVPRKGISVTSFKKNPDYHTEDDAWYAIYNEIKKTILEFKAK